MYYPGLPSHPEHDIAKRQMTGFGGVVSFEVTLSLSIQTFNSWDLNLNFFGEVIIIVLLWLGYDFQVVGDLRSTMKFVDSLKIPYLAPSFGGVESIVDQPAIMSYWYYIYTHFSILHFLYKIKFWSIEIIQLYLQNTSSCYIRLFSYQCFIHCNQILMLCNLLTIYTLII